MFHNISDFGYLTFIISIVFLRQIVNNQLNYLLSKIFSGRKSNSCRSCQQNLSRSRLYPWRDRFITCCLLHKNKIVNLLSLYNCDACLQNLVFQGQYCKSTVIIWWIKSGNRTLHETLSMEIFCGVLLSQYQSPISASISALLCACAYLYSFHHK